jgi:hypothetical protein
MAIVLSAVAIAISLGTLSYSVWLQSQETTDAGNAWRAKRYLEEALIAHLRTLKAELRSNEDPQGLPIGRFLSRATQNLLEALENARRSGLPRVLQHQAQSGTEFREDFLTEWIMLETHVAASLAQLDSIQEIDDRAERGALLDPGQAVFILGGLILKNLAPLSRRAIRKWIKRPLLLTPVEEVVLKELEDQSGAQHL